MRVEEPYRGWEGELVVFDRQVRVFVDARSEATRDARITSAIAQLGPALEAGTNEMVKLYEESWNDGRSVTRALKKVTLERLHIDAAGGCQITLSDGGLFAGHAVLLHVSKAGKVTLSLGG